MVKKGLSVEEKRVKLLEVRVFIGEVKLSLSPQV
jgi:hypothetical protein